MKENHTVTEFLICISVSYTVGEYLKNGKKMIVRQETHAQAR